MLRTIKVLFLASSMILLNTHIDASSASSNSYMSSILNNKLIAGVLGVSLAATCYFGYQWNQSNKKIAACADLDTQANQQKRNNFARLKGHVAQQKAINAQEWTTNNSDFNNLSAIASHDEPGDFSSALWHDKDVTDFKAVLESYERNQKAGTDLTKNKQDLNKYFDKIQKTNFSSTEKQQRHTSFLYKVATGASALALAGTGIYGYLKK